MERSPRIRATESLVNATQDTRPGKRLQFATWKIAIEIMDLTIKNLVICQNELCVCLPEGRTKCRWTSPNIQIGGC